MPVLTDKLRRTLESTVRAARRTAEAGARKTLEHLAVHHHEPWQTLTTEQRSLRTSLRAHAKQLGDRRDERRGTQEIVRLTGECAYEHWHRMLFARFLAESDLLVEPETGMALTLDECREMARERGADWLELASGFATRMLPQIFRAGDPLLEVELPPETRSELENVLEDLPQEVFTAEDSLGWVYQFWQAERRDEVNRSEKKIGAEELPAVTQLFTEDYMVLFLLHNTLGAWWAGKVLLANPELARKATGEDELRAACKIGEIDWTYLRFVRSGEEPWQPAAGTFAGWPKTASQIRVLDPCMGSGHFLVFAFLILVALRMAEESLSESAAIEAVLRNNIYGLEIDPRCTQIAAFNLALAAWRRVGHRPLPRLHLACSGLSIGVNKNEWLKMAEQVAVTAPVPPEKDLFGTRDNLFSARIKEGFARLFDLFEKAPSLGSLIDPRRLAGDIVAADHTQLEPLLTPLLAANQSDELAELAVAAQGMMKAAQVLGANFTLVATNVPFLARGKQDDSLKRFSEQHFNTALGDLCTVFVARLRELCSAGGTYAFVTPEQWTFSLTHQAFRIDLIKSESLNLIAKLGPAAFQVMNWWAARTLLTVITNTLPNQVHTIAFLELPYSKQTEDKPQQLVVSAFDIRLQAEQLLNPDARILSADAHEFSLLSAHADVFAGIQTGDLPKFVRSFFEFGRRPDGWEFLLRTVNEPVPFGGRSLLLLWNDGKSLSQEPQAVIRGMKAIGQMGVCINRTASLAPTLYLGEFFDQNGAVIIPRNQADLRALWCFATSPSYASAVRGLDGNTGVTPATLGKVPFDASHWQEVAEELLPEGVPKPHSNDPTQWLFNGNPRGSDHPLQVAVSRLLGYRWPRQTGSGFPDCPPLATDGLEGHVDPDGIVPLMPLRGEAPATERLITLLAEAYGHEWSAAKLDNLLSKVGFDGKSLDDWLHDGFFTQHCVLFQQRPFVWHVWDGLRDGFHALVNYHRLAGPGGEGKRVLETLLYAYLGGWIDRQRADQRAAVEGADGRLTAAEHLQGELEKILAGDPPYDIFVRWKPLHEQPMGWEPDINDGVRLNIRPFMTARPLNARAKGSCILRATPRIGWDKKDKGKEPTRPREDFPWFWSCDGASTDFPGGREFDGNRWNNLHYSRAVKEAARSRKGSGK